MKNEGRGLAMCLIAFQLKKDAEYPFIFVGNRDEEYIRPSKSIHFWEDAPTILAGRDVKHQGTWLGITRTGRFATLLNHPFTDFQLNSNIESLSRGNLARHFLAENRTVDEYLRNLKKTCYQYDGYHFLFGSLRSLTLYSNTLDREVHFNEGVHSLSNSENDLSSYKLTRSKSLFKDYLTKNDNPELDDLISLFRDDKRNETISLIPEGISRELAVQNTAMFVNGDTFGTVGTTAMIVHRSGDVKVKEVRYNQENQIMHETEHSFKIEI